MKLKHIIVLGLGMALLSSSCKEKETAVDSGNDTKVTTAEGKVGSADADDDSSSIPDPAVTKPGSDPAPVAPKAAADAAPSLSVTEKIAARKVISQNVNNAKQLALGLKIYAIDHDGAYPASLAALEGDIIPELAELNAQKGGPNDTVEWIYFSGLNEDVSGEMILVATPDLGTGTRVVAFNDGVARTIPEAEYQAALKAGGQTEP